jgi:hypothetical protein
MATIGCPTECFITENKAKVIDTLTVLFLYQDPMRAEQDDFFEMVHKI